MTEPKKTVYDILDRIQNDPRSYLRHRSSDSLADFLLGFSIAQHGALFDNFLTEGNPPFHDFAIWFHIHHGAPTAGWLPAIMKKAKNSKEAFDCFFEYLTVYRNRELKFQCGFTVTRDQQRRYSEKIKSRAPKQLRLSQYAGEKCIFVHACWTVRIGWKYHNGFRTLKECERWLAEAYGISASQWQKALSARTNKSGSKKSTLGFTRPK